MNRFQFPRANKTCVEMYLVLDQLTQRTHSIPILLEYLTTLSYLVNGMFQRKKKKKPLTKCRVRSAGWAEFKCVIHHVPLHSRLTAQHQHAICRDMWFYKHALILTEMAPSEFVSILVLSVSVSKYTQMVLTNVVAGHNLSKPYKGSGKGDRWNLILQYFVCHPKHFFYHYTTWERRTRQCLNTIFSTKEGLKNHAVLHNNLLKDVLILLKHIRSVDPEAQKQPRSCSRC